MDVPVHATFQRSPPPWGAQVICGVGLLLAVLWLWYAYTFEYLQPASSFLTPTAVLGLKLVETLVVGSIALSLVYAGVWFNRSHFESEQEWWAVLWTVLGGIGIVSVIVVMNAHQMAEGAGATPGLLVEEIVLGAAGGSLAGLLIGLGTAQSMRQADRVERQRDAFSFLNKLLRHDILNGLSIIQGKVTHIAEDAPDDVQPDLQTIDDRSQSMAELTQNVSRMSRVIAGEAELTPVNVSALLREEVETARRSFEHAQFDVDIPDGVRIDSSHALNGVIDNLLTNAVEHNDTAEPRIAVTLEDSGEIVRIRIADNGPGVPADAKETIFEPNTKGDHGVGLYLVETIISNVGGTVRLTDNEPTGAVFTIELPNSTGRDVPV
jgi:signal transduction histidine kinase